MSSVLLIRVYLSIPDFQFSVNQGEDTAHAVQEATYAYVGWIFAQHFCNRLGSAYLALKNGT
jgi:glutamate dehydrogenase